MKNWLSIGQFSKKAGLTPRTLRVYEDMGLIESHSRSDSGYRMYLENQLELILRIKSFKELGFSLLEIKSLLKADAALDTESLKNFLLMRMSSINQASENLLKQRNQIENILSSIEQKTKGLSPQQRRFVMSHFEEILIVVTGIDHLDLTAEKIRSHLNNLNSQISIQEWHEDLSFPIQKPCVLMIPEKDLTSAKISEVMPDIVVINNISHFDNDLENNYIKLFSSVGPHMATIFNADDRLSIELASNTEIQKGRIFYYTKNSGLDDQLKKIGGVISDGEEIKIYGFNLTKEVVKIKLNKFLSQKEEFSLISSLAAVMDIGLDINQFPKMARNSV